MLDCKHIEELKLFAFFAINFIFILFENKKHLKDKVIDDTGYIGNKYPYLKTNIVHYKL